MGRWADYEEDEHRLPEGMQRIGYDADTQVYTYQDTDGSIWEGSEGARYGQLRQVSGPNPNRSRPQSPRTGLAEDESLLENGENNLSVRHKDDSWRYLAPFFLLVCLFLLLVFRLMRGGSSDPSAGVKCQDSYMPYTITNGDTCWNIAQKHGMEVGQLQQSNPGLNCDPLHLDVVICVRSILS